MKVIQLRQLIRESIKDYVREIDHAGNVAALEAKIAKIKEAIESRKRKMNLEGIDEDMKSMIDEKKVKELGSEIKHLEKSLDKYIKQLEKAKNKAEGKKEPKETEDENKEIVDETSTSVEESMEPGEAEHIYFEEIARQMGEAGADYDSIVDKLEDMGANDRVAAALAHEYMSGEVDESFPESGAQLEEYTDDVDEMGMQDEATHSLEKNMKEETINESFLHMQKLAGILSETEYKNKVQKLTKEHIKRK